MNMTLMYHLAYLGRRCRQVGDEPIEYLDGLPPPSQEQLDATRADAEVAWAAGQAEPENDSTDL